MINTISLMIDEAAIAAVVKPLPGSKTPIKIYLHSGPMIEAPATEAPVIISLWEQWLAAQEEQEEDFDGSPQITE